MCGSCQNNFVKYTWEHCTECASPQSNYILTLIQMVIMFLLIYTISSLQYSISKVANKQYTAFIGLTKLIVNHCVIMTAIHGIKYDWSNMLNTVMSVQ